jgi:LmbE family N-acetylglucosaminyl deacetylase
MTTLVCFHAHPDDEAIGTGGLMAQSAAAGHRVVVVCATRGEQGEVDDGFLSPGETLGERRVKELTEACAVLGAEEPRFLDYEDSGMMGEATNDNPACFWQADVEEAAQRLAAILTDIGPDVLTIYDERGLYGHPDHIQVHRVGLRAAELVGVAQVYESTVNRDDMKRMSEVMEATQAANDGEAEIEAPSAAEMDDFGTPADDVSFTLDVSAHVGAKRNALLAHRSQVADDSWFLAMPEDIFALVFGAESYNVPGRTGTGGPEPVAVLPGLGTA